MSKLHIADGVSLPVDAVTQTFAILAKRGVGKTHAASVMAEEMLKRGQPICVYDPTGAWWGLKSSKDGKRAAYPVVVFGGEHADVPLEETAGETIASVIVERRIPAILDCGLMRKAARIRFMTNFCETLYHKNREPLHFFVDEAQTIAPQNLKAMPEAARLLGAMEDIVMQGRRRGLGLTIISPRPAVVNTNLRSACEVIIAMQIIGPHDRKAISEWIDLHGDDEAKAKEMLGSLSSLERGEAWIWSPGWLHLFKRIVFRDRETFDSSATPEVGGKKIVGPQKVAEIDLDALGEQIRATVEKAKADDPKELRRQIAELQRQLKERPAATVEKVVKVPVLENGHLDLAAEVAQQFRAAADLVVQTVTGLEKQIAPAFAPRAGTLSRPISAARATPAKTPAIPSSRPVHNRSENPTSVPPGELTAPQQAILDTILMLGVRGIDANRDSIARWLDLHPNGGSYGTNLGFLRANGYLEGCRLTELGQSTAHPQETGFDAAMRALPDEPKRAIIRELVSAGKPLTRDELAERLGLHPNGGSYGTNLGRLRTMGLITQRGPIEPTEGLAR